MKEQVSPTILISAAAVAVLLIGFLAYWFFLAPGGDTVDTKTINERIAKKNRH